MSRSQYSMSQQSGYPGVIIGQMIHKENDYKSGIKENHELGKTQAQSLCIGGQLENLLGDVSEYRERLKQLSEKNVQNQRKVDAFVGALKNIASHQGDIQDYQTMLEESIEKELQQINQSSVDVHLETMYLETCRALGEVSEAQKDDELEIVESESSVNLKCPLSGTLLEDPVKNKLCGHVYSRKSIIHHMRIKTQCPVVGCSNKHLTSSQLEEDMATARLVRREQIRRQKLSQQMSQNAIDFDDEEEEF